jgi:ACS family tartrate transporter-like MFS transporter
MVGPVIGLVNAFGNLGGFAGPYIVGWLAKDTGSTAISFNVLGVALLACGGLAFLLPRAARQLQPVTAAMPATRLSP